MAFDVATGRIRGHFQYNPNESWDWDEVSPPILVDYQRNGRTVKGLINVARNGYIWFLERFPDRIGFVDGKPYVTQNVYKSLDPMTGRPDVDDAHKPATGKAAPFCPNAHGGKNWPPVAFSPKTRLMYVPANNNLCGLMTGVAVRYERGQGVHRRAIGHAVPRARRRPRGRGAGLERGHRPEGVDARLRQDAELGLDAGHRRRRGVHGRHQRPQDPRVRCVHRQAAVGGSDQFRHRGAAIDLHA